MAETLWRCCLPPAWWKHSGPESGAGSGTTAPLRPARTGLTLFRGNLIPSSGGGSLVLGVEGLTGIEQKAGTFV
jgi:hypothetical protein